MTISKDKIGLSKWQKYDVREDDTWIGDIGASTHKTNSVEGIFWCMFAINNQYIKVLSRERLQNMKKGYKQCAILQKDGQKT